MKVKDFFAGILLVAVIVLIGYNVNQNANRRTNRDLARQIAEFSPRGRPPETIEGLRRAIALYEDQIERYVRDSAQTGAYWKILGVRLAEQRKHGEALKAFERAIFYSPEDPALFYMSGVSAGIVAKSTVGFLPDSDVEKAQLFNLSENSYLRAIELDNSYVRPMYGLGVLYVFELDRADSAIPHLEKLLELRPSDVQAMFVLARAHFMLKNYSQAVDVYDRIIAAARDTKIRDEAINLREIVQVIRYE